MVYEIQAFVEEVCVGLLALTDYVISNLAQLFFNLGVESVCCWNITNFLEL